MESADAFEVEVVYARPDAHAVCTVRLTPGACVREAIERSGILVRFPEIDLGRQRVGVFGRLCDLDATLAAGDRVEIYRPVRVDPKEARRRRARGHGRSARPSGGDPRGG